MDYKAVIEEQVRKLQELQDRSTKDGCYETSCNIAKTIATLCFQARDI
jgi:glutamate/tyrosine decarboxylase-like PLP-dependent enzyme